MVWLRQEKKAFVPGMAKHAFNGGAAGINGAIAGWDQSFISVYRENARSLERAARLASAAIENLDLKAALTAVYGEEWTNFDPKAASRPRRDI